MAISQAVLFFHLPFKWTPKQVIWCVEHSLYLKFYQQKLTVASCFNLKYSLVLMRRLWQLMLVRQFEINQMKEKIKLLAIKKWFKVIALEISKIWSLKRILCIAKTILALR
jgi:hypothetical protein